jgi:cation diffusion facilitator CzcD-associated flavoprotein CzcO
LDFLVSAVGQLNVPSYPKIPGIEDYAGKLMHSARWDWSYDMRDKKVAVIGNGKSDCHPKEKFRIVSNVGQGVSAV